MDEFEFGLAAQPAADLLVAARDDDALTFAPARDLVAAAHRGNAQRRRAIASISALATVLVVGAAAVLVRGVDTSRVVQPSPTAAATAALPSVCTHPHAGSTGIRVTAAMTRTSTAMAAALCRYAMSDGTPTKYERWISMGGLSGGFDGLTYDLQISYRNGDHTREIWLSVWRPHDAKPRSDITTPTISSTDNSVVSAVWPDGTHLWMQGMVDSPNGTILPAANPALLRTIAADPAFDAFAGIPIEPVAHLWTTEQFESRRASLTAALRQAFPSFTVTWSNGPDTMAQPAPGRLHGDYNWDFAFGDIMGHADVSWAPGGAHLSDDGMPCTSRATGATCYTGTLGDGTLFRVRETCTQLCTGEDVDVSTPDGTTASVRFSANGKPFGSAVVPSGDELARLFATPQLSTN